MINEVINYKTDQFTSSMLSSDSSSSSSSPSSLDDPPSKFTLAVLEKIRDPSAPTNLPDHSRKWDDEYQVYFRAMKEVIIWENQVKAYEDTVENFKPKESDPLVMMFKEMLVPFTHQMQILIRNQQESIAEEIHNILDE
jgi:hypothetical protein